MVSAGPGKPFSPRLPADRLAEAPRRQPADGGCPVEAWTVEAWTVEPRDLATGIVHNLVTRFPAPSCATPSTR
ncbi:hypothetical protein [Streptomyces sp. NPDC006368]|uniref:hypothetical protein n=1 Tax=Streptomyces sp. NPDC006368 TaxID=3156760 RepID=UPI0033BCA227